MAKWTVWDVLNCFQAEHQQWLKDAETSYHRSRGWDVVLRIETSEDYLPNDRLQKLVWKFKDANGDEIVIVHHSCNRVHWFWNILPKLKENLELVEEE